MKSPTQILTELRALQEKLPADLRKKVGNVFLGGNWKIAKLQGVKTPKGSSVAEPNTKWENDLYGKIDAWTSMSGMELAKYFKKNKALLDQLAKEFPQALQPPIGQLAYRGTAIKLNSLEQAFRKKKFEVKKIAGREVFHFKNLQYSPNRSSQSWTVDPKIAFTFDGSSSADGEGVQVVYVTKVNKDFIFSPELMNIIFDREESETVRVAGVGTFEAFVDSSVILNNWKLEPRYNFIHRLPSAEPFFAKMIVMYNKNVDAENKQLGKKWFAHVASVTEMLYLNDHNETPGGFDVYREYAKYAKKYFNSIKKK